MKWLSFEQTCKREVTYRPNFKLQFQHLNNFAHDCVSVTNVGGSETLLCEWLIKTCSKTAKILQIYSSKNDEKSYNFFRWLFGYFLLLSLRNNVSFLANPFYEHSKKNYINNMYMLNKWHFTILHVRHYTIEPLCKRN